MQDVELIENYEKDINYGGIIKMKSKVEELFEKLALSAGSNIKWKDLHPIAQQQICEAINAIHNIVNTGSI